MELEQLKSRLFDCVIRDAPIQEVLNEAAALLGVSLHATDASYKLLAASDVVDNPDPLWEELMINGCFSESTIRQFYASRLPSDLAEGQGSVYFEALGFPYVITPVYVAGKRVASLIALVTGEEQGAALTELLQAVAGVLQNRLLADEVYASYQNQPVELFLKELLSGRVSRPERVESRGRQFGFGEGAQYAMLVVCGGSAERGSFPALHFREVVPRYIPRAVSVIYESSVVVIFPFDDYRWYERLELGELEGYLRRYAVHGCLSNPFEGLKELGEVYRRTLQAIAIGRQGNEGECIYRYARLAVAHLLERAAQVSEIGGFCHPAVKRLRKYDEENGSQYVDTLFYLLTCRKKLDVQRALFIHRNTLDYRIERIQGLISIPWDDPEQLLDLSLSCRMVRENI